MNATASIGRKVPRVLAIIIAFAFTLEIAHCQVTPVGGIARDFVITNHATGGPLRLYDYEGKVVVLKFWAYWCGSCQDAAADMEPNIVQYYHNRGGNAYGIPVQVISINIDFSDPVAADNFIRTYNLELVGDDLFWEAWGQLGEDGVNRIAIINGTTNSANFRPWEVVYLNTGYTRNVIKTKIDSIQSPAPVCTIVSPVQGMTSCPPVTVSATINSNGATIRRIEFYNGITLLGAVTNPPYNVTWNAATEGAKTVQARVHWDTASTVDSSPVTFIVGPAAPGFIAQPTNRIVAAGNSNAFTVAMSGNSPFTYQWQKNGADLAIGGHYSGCTGPTLMIVNCDGNDASGYRCVVSNAHGTNVSNEATLTVVPVNTPPRIVQQPSSQSALPGGTANIFLIATGSEPLSYQWQRNNSNVIEGGHYSGSATAALEISAAEAGVAGSYRCVVSNAFGTTNSASVSVALGGTLGCVRVSNADFESGFSTAGGGYVGNNWIEWETDAGGVIGYDENVIVHNGGHAQRIRLSGGLYGTSGGIYQRLPATPGASCTVGVWVYAADASTACSLGVSPTGGTHPTNGVSWTTPSTNVAWTLKTLTFTAASNYVTIFYKTATSDSVKRNGYFDDGFPSSAGPPILLCADRCGPELRFMWPECPNARLECSDQLTAGASWIAATNPVSFVGGLKSVLLTPDRNLRFFRLATY